MYLCRNQRGANSQWYACVAGERALHTALLTPLPRRDLAHEAAAARPSKQAPDVQARAEAALATGSAPGSPLTHEVVNFYALTGVDDPHALVERHRRFVEDNELDLRGRIYFSEQGVNAQLSGRGDHALRFARFAKEAHPGLREMDVKRWACGAHAFPRLSLRYKPNLVGVPGGCVALPLTDETKRCETLSPTEWREAVEGAAAAEQSDDADGEGQRTVVLDLRNAYEHDVGHFEGARRPDSDTFNEQHLAIPEDIDPEKDRVLMYCTGGIRCDVYSSKMREQGFKNLYSLEGGVANYFKEEGDAAWNGHLFVFDSRLAVPPVSPEETPDPEMTAEALEAALMAVDGKDQREVERYGPPPERGEGRKQRRAKRLARQRQRREAYLLSLGERGTAAAEEAARRLVVRSAEADEGIPSAEEDVDTVLEAKQLERIKRRAIEAAFRNRRG